MSEQVKLPPLGSFSPTQAKENQPSSSKPTEQSRISTFIHGVDKFLGVDTHTTVTNYLEAKLPGKHGNAVKEHIAFGTGFVVGALLGPTKAGYQLGKQISTTNVLKHTFTQDWDSHRIAHNVLQCSVHSLKLAFWAGATVAGGIIGVGLAAIAGVAVGAFVAGEELVKASRTDTPQSESKASKTAKAATQQQQPAPTTIRDHSKPESTPPSSKKQVRWADQLEQVQYFHKNQAPIASLVKGTPESKAPKQSQSSTDLSSQPRVHSNQQKQEDQLVFKHEVPSSIIETEKLLSLSELPALQTSSDAANHIIASLTQYKGKHTVLNSLASHVTEAIDKLLALQKKEPDGQVSHLLAQARSVCVKHYFPDALGNTPVPEKYIEHAIEILRAIDRAQSAI